MSSEMPPMERVFEDYIRSRVREALLKVAGPVIDEAVDEALKEFKVQIEQYKDFQYDRIVVNIMAARKSGEIK